MALWNDIDLRDFSRARRLTRTARQSRGIGRGDRLGLGFGECLTEDRGQKRKTERMMYDE